MHVIGITMANDSHTIPPIDCTILHSRVADLHSSLGWREAHAGPDRLPLTRPAEMALPPGDSLAAFSSAAALRAMPCIHPCCKY